MTRTDPRVSARGGALLAMLLCACSTSSKPPDAPPDAASPDAGAPDAASPDVADMSKLGPAEFFQIAAIHRIEITVPPAAWQRFMAEHADVNITPTLYEADFLLDGTPLRRVAFKTFGWGSRQGNPRKPNLNLDLDKYESGQRYAGLTRLRIKNNGQDVSGLRQPLTYEAMRGAGLWAPRTSYATLTVNKEAYGLYLLEESFTKAFVHERSGDDSGAAYEAEDCQGFVAPKTGCQSLPDFYARPFNPMAGAGEELSAICTVLSKPAAQVLGGLSPHLDVSEWARALAADLAIAGDYDGFSTNGSNFRLYHDTRTGKLRLIIYGPDTTYDPAYVPKPDPLAPAPEAGCSAEYRDVFLEKKEVRALRQGLMSPATIKARADALWRTIGPLVLADPRRPPEIDPEVSRRTIDTYMIKRVEQLVKAGL